jgi:putative multiple sugar transport system substrate-binding protein
MRNTDPRRLAARQKSDKIKLMVWYRAILTLLMRGGFVPEGGETPEQFAVRTVAAKAAPEKMIDLAQAIERQQYAREKSAPGSVKLAREVYDRLLMQTDAVTAYVGYDYQTIGTAIAEYIVNTKQLATAQAENRSHTIEFFMGSPEDNNAVLLYAGIRQVLQPYLDCGVLNCRTGRIAFEDVCIQNWSAELAKTHCQSYLASCYADAPPEIVCAASDEIADGCASALEAIGYATGENWPLLTGQGATETAMQRLASGKQSITVYKALTDLPAACFEAIQSALGITDTEWDGPVCHNGSVSVPARFCEFTLVDQASQS